MEIQNWSLLHLPFKLKFYLETLSSYLSTIQRQYFFVQIESDSNIAITLACLDKAHYLHLAVIMEDIRSFASILNLSFHFIPKFFNISVHWLAKMICISFILANWVACPPQYIFLILMCDYEWSLMYFL